MKRYQTGKQQAHLDWLHGGPCPPPASKESPQPLGCGQWVERDSEAPPEVKVPEFYMSSSSPMLPSTNLTSHGSK